MIMSGMNFHGKACEGVKWARGLRRVPIEGIDILGTGVANEEGRSVRGRGRPASPARGLAKILHADHLLELMVADPNTEHTSRLAYCWTAEAAKKIDVVSFARPLRPAHTNLRQLGPLLGFEVEQHQPV